MSSYNCNINTNQISQTNMQHANSRDNNQYINLNEIFFLNVILMQNSMFSQDLELSNVNSEQSESDYLSNQHFTQCNYQLSNSQYSVLSD